MPNRLRGRKSKRNIAINDQTRLWLRDYQDNCCNPPWEYHSCVGIGDISRSKGTKTRLWCPSDTQYGEFETIALVEGDIPDFTVSFNTNFPLTDDSILEELFDDGCLFDAMVVIGECGNPSTLDDFEKILLLKDVTLNSYNLQGLFAKTPSERAAVTESVEATFYEYYSITKPTFGRLVRQNTDAVFGPIIDSFLFCDNDCCLCENGSGLYLITLTDCGTDCTSVDIRYNNTCKDNEWKRQKAVNCDGLGCNQNLNKTVLSDDDGFYYFHIDGSFGTNVFNTLLNSRVMIPASALLNDAQLLDADGEGNKVVFVGENGYVFIYNTSTKTYTRFRNNSLPTNQDFCSVHICKDDSCTFVIGGENGQAFLWNGSEIEVYSFNTIDRVHNVYVHGCCTVLASIQDTTYISVDGSVTTTNLQGYVTAMEFDDIVGLAVSVIDETTLVSMSIDGGRNWTIIDSSLENDAVYTNISICGDEFVISGSTTTTTLTPAQKIACERNWNCEGQGIVYLSTNMCLSTVSEAC